MSPIVIHPHAGRQLNHARNAANTLRNAVASTPAPIRSRSPVVSTSSRSSSVARCRAGDVSTNANRIGCCFRSRLRQRRRTVRLAPVLHKSEAQTYRCALARRSARANTPFLPRSSFPCWLLSSHHYGPSRTTLVEGFIGRLQISTTAYICGAKSRQWQMLKISGGLQPQACCKMERDPGVRDS